MIGNPLLELGHAGVGAVPASLQLASDEAVFGIGRVILTEGTISSVARRFEIADHGLPRLVTLYRCLRLSGSCGVHGGRLQDGEQCCLDDVIDTQPTESDAIGLSVIESSANA